MSLLLGIALCAVALLIAWGLFVLIDESSRWINGQYDEDEQ